MRSSSRPLPNRLSTFFTAGGGPLLFPEGSICTAGALQLRSTYLSQKARACPLSQASRCSGLDTQVWVWKPTAVGRIEHGNFGRP